jgi:ABC-type glycerol-3-phosphate transport system permease component
MAQNTYVDIYSPEEPFAAPLLRFVRRYWVYIPMLLALAVFLLPMAVLVITSLKKESEYLAYPITFLPAVPQWSNYIEALTRFDFFKYLVNTLFLSTTTTVLTVITSAIVGFGFARHNVPERNKLFTIVVALIILPGLIMTIPQFVIYQRLHLTNTYWPWIIEALGASPFHIFLFRQFFSTFPKELEDAAEIDGCSRPRMFTDIFLPNAGPALTISAIFTFQGVWGDVITPLMYLDNDLLTLAPKIISGAYYDPRGNPIITLTLAGVMIYCAPVIVGFFLGQKKILEGVLRTGLKG